MFEKQLWKSDILSKDAGHRLPSLLKLSVFHRCFSNILPVKPTTWFLRKWNTDPKWVKKTQNLSFLIGSYIHLLEHREQQ